MAEFINTIDVLGEEIVADSIIVRSIAEFRDNTVELIGQRAFSGCNALVSVDMPVATSVKRSAFHACTALESVNLPLVAQMEIYAFRECTSLTSVCFPAALAIDNLVFFGDSKLTRADFTRATSIGTNVFTNCIKLTALILRADTVCTLANTNTFAGTPIDGGGSGRIYVPDNLVDSYKAATNWSTFAAKIKPLSELEE